MKKKIMLLGSSIMCSLGMALFTLTLTLMFTQSLFAQTTESNSCSLGTCVRYGQACAESNCMAAYSGCECGTVLNCACKKANSR
jgi:hypothetical protein